MVTIQSMGNGYYNYYHDKHRYETKDGKASEVWYNRVKMINIDKSYYKRG